MGFIFAYSDRILIKFLCSNFDYPGGTNVGATFGKVKNISPIYAVIEVDQTDSSSFKVGQSAKRYRKGLFNLIECGCIPETT